MSAGASPAAQGERAALAAGYYRHNSGVRRRRARPIASSLHWQLARCGVCGLRAAQGASGFACNCGHRSQAKEGCQREGRPLSCTAILQMCWRGQRPALFRGRSTAQAFDRFARPITAFKQLAPRHPAQPCHRSSQVGNTSSSRRSCTLHTVHCPPHCTFTNAMTLCTRGYHPQAVAWCRRLAAAKAGVQGRPHFNHFKLSVALLHFLILESLLCEGAASRINEWLYTAQREPGRPPHGELLPHGRCLPDCA